GQAPQRGGDLLGVQLSERVWSVGERSSSMGRRVGNLGPLRGVVERDELRARRAAILCTKAVIENAKEPRLEVRTGSESAEAAVSVEDRVVDEVLGVGAFASQAHRHSVRRIENRLDQRLERRFR